MNIGRVMLLSGMALSLPIFMGEVKDAYLRVPQLHSVIIHVDNSLLGRHDGVTWLLERLLPGQRIAEWCGFFYELLPDAW